MLFSEEEIARLLAHLMKEQEVREKVEQENAAIFDLMDRYHKMTNLYYCSQLSPEEEAQYEAIKDAQYDMTLEQEREREALLEAAEEDEEPLVPGRWAEIRRAYLQSYQPEEWLRMLRSGEAVQHLQEVEQATQARYQEMYRIEEERQILGKNLSFMEEVQRSRMIEAQIREIVITDLSY